MLKVYKIIGHKFFFKNNTIYYNQSILLSFVRDLADEKCVVISCRTML